MQRLLHPLSHPWTLGASAVGECDWHSYERGV